MKTRFVHLLSLTTIALAGALAAAVMAMPAAVTSVFADTPGVSPTCFPQSQNPHPTAPIGPTTDPLFCTATATGSSSDGPGTGGSGGSGGGSGGSGSSGSHGSGQTGTNTGSSTTAAGTSGGATTSLANGTTASSGSSGANGTRSSTGTHSTSSPSNGFFGGLGAFLGAAGGLVFLFGFLILLALALFVFAVVGWLRRRGGEGWGNRFARVTHRA